MDAASVRVRVAWDRLRAAGADSDRESTLEFAFLTAVADLEGLQAPEPDAST